MERKNFSPKFIVKIKQTNEGGKVSININRKYSTYFRAYRGLVQGDPLSPILFNFVGDALSAILSKASINAVLDGLLPRRR